MPVCQRCGKGEAEWQCQTCRRVVDADCAKPTSQGVFCIDHAPAATMPAVQLRESMREGKESHNGLKQVFVMLLFLTAGLGALVFIGQFFVQKTVGNVPGAEQFVTILQTSGNLIVYGLIALTALVGFAWFAVRKK